MAITFIGFHSPETGKTKVLYDVELVKQDLLNCFNTKKGERVMFADYGFIGWDLLFELDRPDIKQILESDARRIIDNEPRVQLLSIDVQNITKGYQIVITLNFVYLEKIDDLLIKLTSDTSE